MQIFKQKLCVNFQLSSSSDMASNAVQILDVLIQHLVTEHIDYAVELGLQGRLMPCTIAITFIIRD